MGLTIATRDEHPVRHERRSAFHRHGLGEVADIVVGEIEERGIDPPSRHVAHCRRLRLGEDERAGERRAQSGRAIGQRVWKWQPEGGRIGLGTSPCSMMRLRFTVGSGIGTAESSASL